MFISAAHAQAAGGGILSDPALQSMLPLVLIFVVFYFLLIRPQQKKVKAHRELLANLRKGDTVVTGGGIMGKVVKLEDNVVFVEIADNVRIRVVRTTITDVVGKTEPVKESETKEAEAKKD
jgi:preprotein translocase subunit YajC